MVPPQRSPARPACQGPLTRQPAVATTSLDDEPPPQSPSRFEAAKAGIEKYLAGVDLYFGCAIGPGPSVGEHQIAVGPEVTWSVKEIYSDALFDDMLQAMDGTLAQQKRVEDARHAHIRAMAAELGVENAECMTIGGVTKAIHRKILEQARRQGVPTDGRTIKEVRADLGKRGLAVH